MVRLQAQVTANKTSRSDVFWALNARGHIAAAMDYVNCGHPDLIRKWRVCSNSPHHHARPVGFSCHLRICSDCARRNAARLLSRYLPVARAADEAKHPKFMLKHITLTTGWSLHDHDIDSRIREIWKALNKLLLAVWGDGWQKSGRGWLGGFEFGVEGQKLHLHLLAYCEYIPHAELSAEWEKLTGFGNVWIEAIHGVKEAVKEVLKYATKLSELSPADTALVHDVLRGVRRVRGGGIFYNVPEPEKITNPVCKKCKSPIVDMPCEAFHKILAEESKRLPRASVLLYLIHGNKSEIPPPVREIPQFGVLLSDQRIHTRILKLTGRA